MSHARPSEPATRAGRSLSRRQLLVGTGAAVALAACGGGDGADGEGSAGDGPSPVPAEDPIRNLLDLVGVPAEPELSVLVASFEMLTGPGRRMQFGLLDATRVPMIDQDLRVWLVREGDKEIVQGPVVPTFHDEGLGNRGIYVFESEIPAPGIHNLVVATGDGSAGGAAALNIITPDVSPIVQVGAAFPASATPTSEAPGDLEELCTLEPDCGMHGSSLDTALGAGKPTVLTIATPKYCVSQICGPVVSIVEGVRLESGRDDIEWIHVEVFKDAGNTPVELVTELGLPSEPWVYLIDADGNLADKFDGPMTADLLRDSLGKI